MATHSSVLAWRIPGMREPGGLPSMGSHRVKHNWSDLAAVAPALVLFWAPQVIQWLRIHLQCRRCRRHRFDPWVGKIPWRRKWQPTSVFLPGESHGLRSLAGYSPWGYKELAISEHVCTSSISLTRLYELNTTIKAFRTISMGMAIHSGILAWKIPRTEEPDRLQSKGSQRVRHVYTILYIFSGITFVLV